MDQLGDLFTQSALVYAGQGYAVALAAIGGSGSAVAAVLSVLSTLRALPPSGRELCGDVRLHLLQQNLSFDSALMR